MRRDREQGRDALLFECIFVYVLDKKMNKGYYKAKFEKKSQKVLQNNKK